MVVMTMALLVGLVGWLRAGRGGVAALEGGLPPPRMAQPTPPGVTPIGPFCPFRSPSCEQQFGDRIEGLSSSTPRFMTELARMQLAMQTGQPLDPSRVREVALEMRSALEDWEGLLGRMALADDFQSREYRKMTTAHLNNSGQSVESVNQAMRWQTDCMLAFSDGRPAPMPPASLDLEKLAESSAGTSPMGAMGAGNAMTSSPFSGSESVFNVRSLGWPLPLLLLCLPLALTAYHVCRARS